MEVTFEFMIFPLAEEGRDAPMVNRIVTFNYPLERLNSPEFVQELLEEQKKFYLEHANLFRVDEHGCTVYMVTERCYNKFT